MNFNITESPIDITLQEDLEETARSGGLWKEIYGSTILVTGATGLVGSLMVKSLACINRMDNAGIQILALVRNIKKAEGIYGELLRRGDVRLIQGDITGKLDIDYDIDYIIHGAAVTASGTMVSRPVETLMTAVSGTENLLKLASDKKVKCFIYLSSMEVYGKYTDGSYITEDMMGYVDPLIVRSNYPLGKRVCENLCAAWMSEYKVPVRIARLAQTFGAGILEGENRVFAQFARSVVEGHDIVLHTKGLSEGNYCYTADTVRALLTILIKGQDGEAYNISNEENHTTIAQMAEFAADKLAGGKIRVVFDIPETNKYGYAADTRMKLCSAKLRELGWKPVYNLEASYRRMISSMMANNC